MDIQRTMEFMLQQQARFDANQARFEENQARIEKNFAEAEARMDRAEARLDRGEARLDRLERVVAQNNRLVVRLARAGLVLRGNQRRHELRINRIEENLAEVTDKLNVLTDIVDKLSRRNGRPGRQN